MSSVNVVDANVTLCPSCSSHANVADEHRPSIQYCSSLRPHRPLKIMIPPNVNRHEAHLEEWDDCKRSSDTYSCTRDSIMEEACQRWWHCRAKGDEYTPPWIRLPDHLP